MFFFKGEQRANKLRRKNTEEKATTAQFGWRKTEAEFFFSFHRVKDFFFFGT